MSSAAEYAARAAGARKWKVEPRQPGIGATLVEVWGHRRFLRYLGYRTLRKMYQRTALGWSWLIIRPVLPVALRALVFGGLLAVPSDGIPYFMFLLIGTLLWDTFAAGLMWGTRGLELHRGVLSRIYIPLVILPIATMSPLALDLGIGAIIVAITALYYLWTDGTTYLTFGLETLWAVGALALTLVFVFALSLFTAQWGEKARDARLVMTQVGAVWFLLTPILYPVSLVPREYQGWMALNPMAAYIEAFKYGVLGIGEVDGWRFGTAAAVTAVLLVGGFLLFGRREALGED